MKPFVVNGRVWKVERVPIGDSRLIDRTGEARLAVTDPMAMKIYVSEAVRPPLLDRVMLHEAAHAVAVSYGLLGHLRASLPKSVWVAAEEWAAGFVEGYGMEAAALASEAIGRPVCVRGFCDDRS